MKTLIYFSICLLICISSSVGLAQPNTWLDPYQITKGKKTSYYATQANKNLRKENYNASVINAAQALSMAEKKRRIKKAQEALREAYPLAISTSEARIEELKTESDNFVGDRTVNAQYNIVRLYQEMVSFTTALRELPEEILKSRSRKKEDVAIEFHDYTDKLAKAERQLEEGRQLAAEHHYAEASEKMLLNDVKSCKSAAKQFKLASEYVPNYEDSEEKYEEARLLGTTRMFVTEFHNKSGLSNYVHLGSTPRAHIETAIKKNAPYEFFELVDLNTVLAQKQPDGTASINAEQIIEDIQGTNGSSTEYGEGEDNELIQRLLDRGVHLILRGEITQAQSSRKTNEPVTETIEREVVVKKEKYTDSEGKQKEREIKRKVTASYTTYSRESTGVVEGVYHIVDLATGNVIDTQRIEGTSHFFDDWARFTGDERALDKYQKRKAKGKPIEFPEKQKMIYNAANDFSKKAASNVLEYVTKVGS